MINWFMEQTLSLSMVCLAILLLHRFLLSKLGAHYTYFMWISVPLFVFADLLQMILPQHFSWFGSSNGVSVIEQYYVLANDTVALSAGLLDQLYLPYLYAAVVALLVINGE
mgnify:FL=1